MKVRGKIYFEDLCTVPKGERGKYMVNYENLDTEKPGFYVKFRQNKWWDFSVVIENGYQYGDPERIALYFEGLAHSIRQKYKI